MTQTQYKKAIEALELNQAAAGRAFGLSPRQAQRLAAGESKIPEPIAILIRLMLRLGLTAEDLHPTS